MRLGAGLASTKLTLLPRSSSTSWTTDSEYLLWAEFFFHDGERIPPNQRTGMVNLEQLWQLPCQTHKDEIFSRTERTVCFCGSAMVNCRRAAHNSVRPTNFGLLLGAGGVTVGVPFRPGCGPAAHLAGR
jgi:hypothetical protein